MASLAVNAKDSNPISQGCWLPRSGRIVVSWGQQCLIFTQESYKMSHLWNKDLSVFFTLSSWWWRMEGLYPTMHRLRGAQTCTCTTTFLVNVQVPTRRTCMSLEEESSANTGRTCKFSLTDIFMMWRSWRLQKKTMFCSPQCEEINQWKF